MSFPLCKRIVFRYNNYPIAPTLYSITALNNLEQKGKIMGDQLTKKYGLPTAIAMVIGIVIGSGIFFKAEKILTATGGDLKIGILAWLLGGCIAIASACAFAVMATRYEKVGGWWTMPRPRWEKDTPII